MIIVAIWAMIRNGGMAVGVVCFSCLAAERHNVCMSRASFGG